MLVLAVIVHKLKYALMGAAPPAGEHGVSSDHPRVDSYGGLRDSRKTRTFWACGAPAAMTLR